MCFSVDQTLHYCFAEQLKLQLCKLWTSQFKLNTNHLRLNTNQISNHLHAVCAHTHSTVHNSRGVCLYIIMNCGPLRCKSRLQIRSLTETCCLWRTPCVNNVVSLSNFFELVQVASLAWTGTEHVETTAPPDEVDRVTKSCFGTHDQMVCPYQLSMAKCVNSVMSKERCWCSRKRKNRKGKVTTSDKCQIKM